MRYVLPPKAPKTEPAKRSVRRAWDRRAVSPRLHCTEVPRWREQPGRSPVWPHVQVRRSLSWTRRNTKHIEKAKGKQLELNI